MQGDLATHEFATGSFDLVYSIGVLAEHVPLDAAIVARVCALAAARRPVCVHDRASRSRPIVPRTLPRRLAERWRCRSLPGVVGRALHDRLMAGGMYGDERWMRERLADGFAIETLERFRSDVHLHGRCVARKAGE